MKRAKTHKATIEVHEYGWVVCPPKGSGGVGVLDYIEVNQLAQDTLGDALIWPSIAHVLGRRRRGEKITAVYATPAQAEKWRAQLAAELEAEYPDPVKRWTQGLDYGASGLAVWMRLYSPLAGDPDDDELKMRLQGSLPTDYPRDWDDFGRCYRVLRLSGEARSIEVMRGACVEWDALVGVWARLEEAYEARDHEWFDGLMKAARQKWSRR